MNVMKKRMMIGLVLFLLVLSSFSVLALDTTNTSTTCTGFWGSISCFLFGSAENRAGRSWFDRTNVVEEVAIIDRKDFKILVQELSSEDINKLETKGYLRSLVGDYYFDKQTGKVSYVGEDNYRNQVSLYLSDGVWTATPPASTSSGTTSPAPTSGSSGGGTSASPTIPVGDGSWSCGERTCICENGLGCSDNAGNTYSPGETIVIKDTPVPTPAAATAPAKPAPAAPEPAASTSLPATASPTPNPSGLTDSQLLTLREHTTWADESAVNQLDLLKSGKILATEEGKIYMKGDKLFYLELEGLKEYEISAEGKLSTSTIITPITDSDKTQLKEVGLTDDKILELEIRHTLPSGRDEIVGQYTFDPSTKQVRHIKPGEKLELRSTEWVPLIDLDISKFIAGNTNAQKMLDDWKGSSSTLVELAKDDKIATFTNDKGTITLESLAPTTTGSSLIDARSVKVTFTPKGSPELKQTLLQVQSPTGYSTLASYNSDEAKKGILNMGTQQIYVGEGITGGSSILAKALEDLGKGNVITYYKDAESKARGESLGSVKYNLEDKVKTVTDFEAETQIKDDLRKGTRTKIDGDIYTSADRGSGCNAPTSIGYVGGSGSATSMGAASVCFQPQGAIESRVNPDGSTTNLALLNYNYDSDEKLTETEIYDPNTGIYIGADVEVNGYGTVRMVRDGTAMRVTYNGREATFQKGSDGKYVAISGTITEKGSVDNFLAWSKAVYELPPTELLNYERMERLKKSDMRSLADAALISNDKSWVELNTPDREKLFSIINTPASGQGESYEEFSLQHAAVSQDINAPYYVTAEGNIYTDRSTSFLSDIEKEAAIKKLGYKQYDDLINIAVTLTNDALEQKKRELVAAETKVIKKTSASPSTTVGEQALVKTAPPEVSAQTVLSSIYAITNSIKSYPALSDLIFNKIAGGVDWYDDWQRKFDQQFAPALGSQWFPSAICESSWDIEPDGMAMIKTPSGTYQAVAHIEAEISPQKTPKLCERYETNETEELQWVCGKKEICINNNLCYPDLDENGEADIDSQPIQAYFYKITWAASAPSDESLTPYIDEDGVAVSLNIFIDSSIDDEVSEGALPLYKKGAQTEGVIELRNGARDKNVITKYSANLFSEACIGWDKAPSTINIAHSVGDVSVGTCTINDVCIPIIESTLGQVNWDQSGRPSSTTSTSPDVALNTDW